FAGGEEDARGCGRDAEQDASGVFAGQQQPVEGEQPRASEQKNQTQEQGPAPPLGLGCKRVEIVAVFGPGNIRRYHGRTPAAQKDRETPGTWRGSTRARRLL